MNPIDIGSRRELFVDQHLVDHTSGDLRFQLHTPTPRELVLTPDNPWESHLAGYITVFNDGDRYRMYYKGQMARHVPGEAELQVGDEEILICYAESRDGIHWEKPNLGIHSFQGSKDNNLVWKGMGSHGFSPFKDTNPDCLPEQRYKAFGRSRVFRESDDPQLRGKWRMLMALTSPDGLKWSLVKGPQWYGSVLGRDEGYYDSQNVGFWDEQLGRYRLYLRTLRNVTSRDEHAGREDGEGAFEKAAKVREIALSTSTDFLNWSEPECLSYPGVPDEELYTGQILRYHRAPHLFLGFPARYVENRGRLTDWHEQHYQQDPDRTYTSYTDSLFMSSRDGQTFHRWRDAFMVPSMPEQHRWQYGECYLSWGMLETKADVPDAPDEFSFYAAEGYRTGVYPGIRRYTIRQDGFASARASATGGELRTQPLMFTGDRLLLNMRTSAAGDIRVEVQDPDGQPIEGYALENCPPYFGNTLAREVRWQDGRGVAPLAGKPVRLRFVMHDADLFALKVE